MLEYAKIDSQREIMLEAAFINEHIDHWNVPAAVRVGVVVYHDTVSEVIHIDQFSDKVALKNKINQVAKGLNPSGDADLARAFDYVREFSFMSARPGAARVAVPFVHQMDLSPRGQTEILNAAQRLKDSCVTVIAFAIHSHGGQVNFDTLHKMVTQPVQSHYQPYATYDDMPTDFMGKHCPTGTVVG